jgi:hypothetical protein
MDRPNYEILSPLIVADRLAEARREALADLAPPVPKFGDKLALLLGALLVRLGCRLDAAGRKRRYARPLTLMPSPCGNGK